MFESKGRLSHCDSGTVLGYALQFIVKPIYTFVRLHSPTRAVDNVCGNMAIYSKLLPFEFLCGSKSLGTG